MQKWYMQPQRTVIKVSDHYLVIIPRKQQHIESNTSRTSLAHSLLMFLAQLGPWRSLHLEYKNKSDNHFSNYICL